MIFAVSYPVMNNCNKRSYTDRGNFKGLLGHLGKLTETNSPTIEELLSHCLNIESKSNRITGSLKELYKLGRSNKKEVIDALEEIANFYEKGEGKNKRPAIAQSISKNSRKFAAQLNENKFFDD